MDKHYPNFSSHDEVSCFNCGGDLGDYPFKSLNAKGNGEFVQDCAKCGMATWYDMDETAPSIKNVEPEAN